MFPDDEQGLVSLPGRQKYSRGNYGVCIQSTGDFHRNERVRGIYPSFFADHDDVDDKDIRVLLEETIDVVHPREFWSGQLDGLRQLAEEARGSSWTQQTLQKRRH